MIRFLQRHRTVVRLLNRFWQPWVSRRVWAKLERDPRFVASLEQGLADLRAGRLSPYPPTRPELSPTVNDWIRDRDGTWAPPPGTADTAPAAPPDIPEGSTPLLVPYFAKVTGEDGSSMYVPVGDSSSFAWSTGARVRVASSTSTGTRSPDSLIHHGDC